MTPTVDIFIRSYSGDFEWLSFCLRSIQKYAHGFRKTVLVTPFGHNPAIGTAEVLFHVEETFEGYMHQQLTKLNADCFTDADYILFTDSDTIFTREITPNDLIGIGGRVKWLYTERDTMGEGRDVWRKETEKAVQRPVDKEFMRRHPFCVPRWALPEMRAWFLRSHGVSLERYIAMQPNREFSEWNCLGAWLWHNHRNEVNWINTAFDKEEPFVKQHFSWGGLKPEMRDEMAAMLA